MGKFAQTRDEGLVDKSFGEILLNPKAKNGGLYTLSEIPKLEVDSLIGLNYFELAREVFRAIGCECEELEGALGSYKKFEDPSNPAKLARLNENTFIQELYNGPTKAFKDMALQPFGEIFSKKIGTDKYLIITATSGDTGPATLESFAGRENIFVVCMYPSGGTSDVQRLQMCTQEAKNIKTIGIEGNFDDAQRILKGLLNDEGFAREIGDMKISVANSVNFGRIAFQIIYHIWGYINLVQMGAIKCGESINIVVPSGNFGNALGAFFAKKMGVGIDKITIASNKNKILSELINDGVYDLRDKKLVSTYSPAMDILKSSNVERMLFALFGAKRTKELMESLESDGVYRLSDEELAEVQRHFDAFWCDDEGCLKAIKEVYSMGRLIDPHTACGYFARGEIDSKPTIVCSTAHWSKFAPTVAYALTNENLGDKEALEKIERITKEAIPKEIDALFSKEVVHKGVVKEGEVRGEILSWIKSQSVFGGN